MNLSVNRAHELAKSLGATMQAESDVIFEERDRTRRPVTFGVATDGVVERLRLVKDAHEIEMLRRGGAAALGGGGGRYSATQGRV